MRRVAVAMLALVVVGLGALTVWDFVKSGKRLPPLAAPGHRATLILVEKAAHRLTLFNDGHVIKTFRVALGHHPTGPKQREGDSRTPEGEYTIDSRNGRSHFHLALHISYPSAADRARAARQGVAPGSDIMIHGLPNGLGWLGGLHRSLDWTDGCVAVTNQEMEEIWALVGTGTPVKIEP